MEKSTNARSPASRAPQQSKLHTRPAEASQLQPQGPSILWRNDPVAPERREGLCFSVRVCAERECLCRDVHVAGMRIDETTEAISETAEGLTEWRKANAEGAGGARHFGATVDVATGEVIPSRRNENPDLYAWFAESVDGELLEHLHVCWMRAKGYRTGAPRSDADLSGWKSGEIVFFEEVFLDERQDLYAIEGRTYLLADGYCVNPACTCNEARFSVAFVRKEGKPAEELGTFVVDLGSGSLKSLATKGPARELLLRRVWACALARHRRLPERLARRRARLLEAVPSLLAPRAPQVQRAVPGRNAPCPCGSGAKFKRCCIGKPEWT